NLVQRLVPRLQPAFVQLFHRAATPIVRSALDLFAEARDLRFGLLHAILDPGAELVCLGAELLVAEPLHLRLQSVDLHHQRRYPLEITFVLSAKNLGQGFSDQFLRPSSTVLKFKKRTRIKPNILEHSAFSSQHSATSPLSMPGKPFWPTKE